MIEHRANGAGTAAETNAQHGNERHFIPTGGANGRQNDHKRARAAPFRRRAQKVRPGRRPSRVQGRLPLRALRRPAPGHREAQPRHPRGQALPNASGRHGLGQDIHHGEDHRGRGQTGAHPRAQQDARRPGGKRAARVLPEQRGGVLRLLLRLLPARGVHPLHRHLHREGLLDQRGHRKAAPPGHCRPAQPQGRHRSRLGELHLRYRQPRGLRGHGAQRAQGHTA